MRRAQTVAKTGRWIKKLTNNGSNPLVKHLVEGDAQTAAPNLAGGLHRCPVNQELRTGDDDLISIVQS
jgi:hypothetical protein